MLSSAGMARLPRYIVPDQPQHVIQRGNNRSPIFLAPADYGLYRELLAAAAAAHDCAIHAYVLMTNHVHLLLTPRESASIPDTMQALGRRYVRHINNREHRSGTLWEGRYRATVIDSEAYLLACCRYIELNPVRAGMVRHPRDYPWSSHRRHAEGASDALVAPHALYSALGATPQARQDAYRALFAEALDPDFVAAVRHATNTGWALGDPAFQDRVARAAGRRATPLPRGRPKKADESTVR
jgi:putative transposase